MYKASKTQLIDAGELKTYRTNTEKGRGVIGTSTNEAAVIGGFAKRAR